MSAFFRELQLTAECHFPESIDSCRKNIPIEWISQAVNHTGRAAIRKRRFPAEQAVWLVLGIGFMRNRSISDACDKLELASSDAKGDLPPLATSSIVKAR